MSQIHVMVNTRFGGFRLSDEAMAEFRQRALSTAEEPQEEIQRHNPLMVQIVMELGPRASVPYSLIELQPIPAQYADHYEIHDNDGMESVTILYDKYKVDSSRALLCDLGLTKEQKLERLAAILM